MPVVHIHTYIGLCHALLSNCVKYEPLSNSQHINSGIFTKFDNPDVLKEIAHGWIGGKSYDDLLNIIIKHETKMIWGTQRRELTIEHLVDVCEGALAYNGALLIGALCEFVKTLNQDNDRNLMNHLQLFQKRLKYGLPNETTIVFYELGFFDRVISQDVVASLSLSATQKKELVKALKQDKEGAALVIKKYPSYFQERLQELFDDKI